MQWVQWFVQDILGGAVILLYILAVILVAVVIGVISSAYEWIKEKARPPKRTGQ